MADIKKETATGPVQGEGGANAAPVANTAPTSKLPVTNKAGQRPDYVAFGSAEHAALLGLAERPDDASKAATVAQLQATPVVQPNAKQPVTPANYRPTTRTHTGDPLPGGFTRRGPR